MIKNIFKSRTMGRSFLGDFTLEGVKGHFVLIIRKRSVEDGIKNKSYDLLGLIYNNISLC